MSRALTVSKAESLLCAAAITTARAIAATVIRCLLKDVIVLQSVLR